MVDKRMISGGGGGGMDREREREREREKRGKQNGILLHQI